MSQPDRYAVIGFPIQHSKSPRIHTLFAQQTGQNLLYERFEVKPENFTDFVENFFAEGGKGLNCTLPLKELAFAFADDLTDSANFVMAANTLWQKNGRIFGDNTDGVGLVTDLFDNHGIELEKKRILILGAGGATRGIVALLSEYNLAEMVVANRTVEKALQLAEMFNNLGITLEGCGFSDLEGRQFDLIINATSASLFGNLPPLPAGILAKNGVCYDLAYGNEPTAFVRWGRENNALKSLDGLGMLVEQAAAAFYLWRGVRPETKAVIDLLNSERA